MSSSRFASSSSTFWWNRSSVVASSCSATVSFGFSHAASRIKARTTLMARNLPQRLGLVAPRAAVRVDLVDVREELRVVRVIAERRRVGNDEQEMLGAGQRDVHAPRVREKPELAGVVAAHEVDDHRLLLAALEAVDGADL